MADENNKDEKVNEAIAEAKTNINALEKWLESINKKLPQIPKKGRDVLARLAPWLTLVGGVISLFGAWSFWQAGHAVSKLVEWSNNLSRIYGSNDAIGASSLSITWYIAFVLLIVQAVLLLMAFPKLKDGKRSGWSLLFYNSLLTGVIALVYLFTPSYGFSSLLGYLVGTAVSLYLLFQIREHFTKK